MKKLRIIFFAGKGGVGKTTMAAATALHCAGLGYRTLAISTDPAHSLSDSFETALGGKTVPVVDGLDALEVDPFTELDNNWGQIRDYLSSLLTSLGADSSLAGELATIPGMDNLFCLLRIKEIYESRRYDVLIVDMAPTGESLRLLSLPQAVSLALKITRYLEKYLISPVIRPASRVSRSLRNMVAPEEVTRLWEQVLERLLDIRQILEVNTTTSTRLVLNPERMVLSESRRALTYFSLFGMVTDLVIVNRLLPRFVRDDYFAEWSMTQQKYLAEIREQFAPLPIREVRLFRDEVVGKKRLTLLGRTLYGGTDPALLWFAERPFRIRKTRREMVFSVQLPFASAENVELTTRGNELIIRLNHQIKTYILPDSFSGHTPDGAEYRDGWLEISFKRSRDTRNSTRKDTE